MPNSALFHFLYWTRLWPGTETVFNQKQTKRPRRCLVHHKRTMNLKLCRELSRKIIAKPDCSTIYAYEFPGGVIRFFCIPICEPGTAFFE